MQHLVPLPMDRLTGRVCANVGVSGSRKKKTRVEEEGGKTKWGLLKLGSLSHVDFFKTALVFCHYLFHHPYHQRAENVEFQAETIPGTSKIFHSLPGT